MLGVYINPDKTQIVQGQLKKQTIQISQWNEMGSYWNALQSGRADGLTSLMQEIKKMQRSSGEEVYITLADNIFTIVSCYQNGSDQIFNQQLRNNLSGKLNSYYVITPHEAKAPFRPRKSVYAVKKEIIDGLQKAANEQDVFLVSVEPSSISFARSKQMWRLDYAVVEMFKDQACIFTVSPCAGVFRQDAPDLSEEVLKRNREQAEENIRVAYSTNTFTGSSFFKVISPDLKYTVLTEYRELQELETVKKNSEQGKCLFPPFVSGGPTASEQLRWMIPVGAFIQDYPDKAALYPGKPDGTIIHSANLLPQDVQRSNDLKKKKSMASRGLRAVAAGLALVLATEAGAIYFFTQEKIDPAAMTSYNNEKAANAQVKRSLEAIKIAVKEDAQTYNYLISLLNSRPNECLFSKVTIGSAQTSKKDAKAFVRIKAHSRNQISFNDYVGKLQQDKHFVNPVIENVQQQNNTGYMTSSIQIGKGEQYKDGKP